MDTIGNPNTSDGINYDEVIGIAKSVVLLMLQTFVMHCVGNPSRTNGFFLNAANILLIPPIGIKFLRFALYSVISILVLRVFYTVRLLSKDSYNLEIYTLLATLVVMVGLSFVILSIAEYYYTVTPTAQQDAQGNQITFDDWINRNFGEDPIYSIFMNGYMVSLAFRMLYQLNMLLARKLEPGF